MVRCYLVIVAVTLIVCSAAHAQTKPSAAAPTTAAPAPDCTPGYDPCIPPGPDVDCAGGSALNGVGIEADRVDPEPDEEFRDLYKACERHDLPVFASGWFYTVGRDEALYERNIVKARLPPNEKMAGITLNRKMLSQIAIEDPKVYSRPWKISMPLYRRLEKNAQLLEFKCVEFVEELMYGHLRKQPSK